MTGGFRDVESEYLRALTVTYTIEKAIIMHVRMGREEVSDYHAVESLTAVTQTRTTTAPWCVFSIQDSSIREPAVQKEMRSSDGGLK